MFLHHTKQLLGWWSCVEVIEIKFKQRHRIFVTVSQLAALNLSRLLAVLACSSVLLHIMFPDSIKQLIEIFVSSMVLMIILNKVWPQQHWYHLCAHKQRKANLVFNLLESSGDFLSQTPVTYSLYYTENSSIEISNCGMGMFTKRIFLIYAISMGMTFYISCFVNSLSMAGARPNYCDHRITHVKISSVILEGYKCTLQSAPCFTLSKWVQLQLAEKSHPLLRSLAKKDETAVHSEELKLNAAHLFIQEAIADQGRYIGST